MTTIKDYLKKSQSEIEDLTVFKRDAYCILRDIIDEMRSDIKDCEIERACSDALEHYADGCILAAMAFPRMHLIESLEHMYLCVGYTQLLYMGKSLIEADEDGEYARVSDILRERTDDLKQFLDVLYHVRDRVAARERKMGYYDL